MWYYNLMEYSRKNILCEMNYHIAQVLLFQAGYITLFLVVHTYIIKSP